MFHGTLQAMLMPRWLLLLLAVVLLVPGRVHSAQDEPIDWDIVPGWDGRFRGGAWFPLAVTVSNSGPDIRGDLRFQLAGLGQTSYTLPIDLPHNARKRVLLPVQSVLGDAGARRGTLTLSDGTAEVKSERVLLTGIDNFAFVVGVVSEGESLPELSNLQGRGQSATLLRLNSAEFPEQPELLQSFDVLFLADADTAAWTEAQRAALAAWLNQGNTLVVGGAPDVLRGLEQVLPAAWQENGASSSVAALNEGSGFEARADAPPVPVLSLEPRSGAETLWVGDAGLPLMVRGHYGLGVVLQAAFGLEQLSQAGEAARLWQSLVLPFGDRPPVWLELRQRAFNAVQNALELPELGLPSILGFIGFLLLYILAVGPLNYLVLRRLDRREWAYFTIPLVVLMFSGVAYVWGSLGRGRDAQVNELAIVRVEPGGERARATSYLTLFSPVRQHYDVGVLDDTLVGSIDAWDAGGSRLDVRYDEAGVSLPGMLIDVGGVRAFTAEHTADFAPLEAEREGDGNVRLRNTGDALIEDIALVRGDGMAQNVGSLAPGQEQTVRFAPVEFVQSVSASGDGPFDRQSVINQLGNSLILAGASDIVPAVPNGALAPGVKVAPAAGNRDFYPAPGVVVAPGADPQRLSLPDRSDDLFVIGWQPRATVETTVNGWPAPISGESLYIWPVSGQAP